MVKIRKFKIRRFKKEDAKELCKLLSDTFNQFVAPGFPKKGIKKWLEKRTPERLIEDSKTRDIFVAVVNNKIVGMIEGKENNRISKLFIDKKYHNKGIGRELMNKMENLYKRRGSKKILIASSLYAQKFYEKMGYRKSTRLIKGKDVLYQPMRKILK